MQSTRLTAGGAEVPTPAGVERKLRRRLLIAALLLLAPWLFYLLAANLVLLTGMGWVVGSSNQITLGYDRAWSLWPGRAQLRGFRLTFQDVNLQFAIDLEKADVRFDISELTARTFHVTRLRGEGTSFRMRHRIAPESASAPWVRAFAPIPEFRDPPLLEASVPEPPIPDSEYDLWTIHLEDVDVGVSELWVQFVRFAGQGRASGAFRLEPARKLWVGPATLALAQGRVSIGESTLLSDLSGSIGCTVDPFDVRKPVGLEPLRYISLDLALKGRGVQLDALPRWFGTDSALQVHTQPGTLSVAVEAKQGRALPKSSVALDLPSIDVSRERWSGAARNLRVELLATDNGHGEARLALAEAELHSRQREGIAPARLSTLTASTEVSSVDAATADKAQVLSRTLRIERFELPDARWLNGSAIELPFEVVAGSVQGQLAVDERAERVNGRATAQITGLRGRAESFEIATQGALESTLKKTSTSAWTTHTELDLTDSKLRSIVRDVDCPWAELPKAHFELDTKHATGVDQAKLFARLPQLSAGWGDFTGKGGLEVRSELSRGVGEARVPRLEFDVAGSGIQVQSSQSQQAGWQARLPKFSWKGQLSGGASGSGSGRLLAPRATARIGSARLAADVDAQIHVSRLDVERRQTHFAGTVSVRRADVKAGSERVEDWWAKIRVDSGLLAVSRNLDLSAPFHADLRDATPALAILAAGGKVSSWLTELVPLREIAVTGIAQRRCQLTDLLVTQASGGPLSGRGRLHSTSDAVRAAFLLRLEGLEALSAGVALGEAGTDIAPLVGDDWLKEHSSELDRRAKTALNSPCPSPPAECGGS